MDERQAGQEHVANYGWRVTMAGLGINLALGILYTWSVISKRIPDDWGWDETEKSWPYSIACLVFALMMVPAGRLQDKIGPRIVASIGGLLVGAGMILASSTTSYTGYILWIGVVAATGIGFGYASATPPAVKWFPAARTGMIAGLVVSGFGLASVYAAPLTKWMIGAYDIPTTMLCLGGAFLIVVVGLAQLLKPPPKGYVPGGAVKSGIAAQNAKKENFSPLDMLRTWQFYPLWFMYVCGAGAGLMIIAKLDKIAETQAKIDLGFLLVAALAIGNGGGRILAGMLSDKLGRQRTMCGCFVLQAILMVLLSLANADTTVADAAAKGIALPVLASVPLLASIPALAVISALIGANYGANLSLFPSITKDYYGLKNFGVNYGLIFTAWGIGGFLLSLLAGKLKDAHQHFYYSYYVAAGLLLVAAVITFFVRPPRGVQHAEQ